MNSDFVQESEIETARRPVTGLFTGWELVIFELEDEPDVGLALSWPSGAA